MKVVVALALLLVVGVAGGWLGVFKGFSVFLGMVKINVSMVFEVVVAIAFVILLENLILCMLTIVKKIGGRAQTLSTVISSLVRYAAVIIGACWSLSIIGVDVSTIFASLGIVALILGFGAESLVADLVTGVFILFENQFNVGDIIEVSGFRGTVKEIGIRTTSLEDTGKNVKIINNADLKDILNRSNQRSVAVSEICVSYDTDLDALEEILKDILAKIKEENKDIFSDRVEYIGVEELSDSWIRLKFVADVEEKDIYAGKRRLNKCLKQAFDKANINIPFPQMDVHMK